MPPNPHHSFEVSSLGEICGRKQHQLGLCEKSVVPMSKNKYHALLDHLDVEFADALGGCEPGVSDTAR